MWHYKSKESKVQNRKCFLNTVINEHRLFTGKKQLARLKLWILFDLTSNVIFLSHSDYSVFKVFEYRVALKAVKFI